MSNFQKSQIVIKCRGCHRKCRILYDRHHDEHFSAACGRVVFQSGEWLVHDDDDFIKWISIRDGLFY